MKLEKIFIDKFIGSGHTSSPGSKLEYRKLLKEFAVNNFLNYKEQNFNIESEGDFTNVIIHSKCFNPGKPFTILTTHYDHIDLAGPGANEKSGVPIVLKLAELLEDPQYLFLIADREEANDGKVFESLQQKTKPLTDAIIEEYKKTYTQNGETDWSHWNEEDWCGKYRKTLTPNYGLGDKHFIEPLGFLLGDLENNIRLVLNFDSLGGKGDFKTHVCSTNKDLGEMMKTYLRKEGVQTFNKFHNGIASQWQHYIEAGIKDCMLIIDDLQGYKRWHTKEDSIDKISFDKLEKILKASYNFLKEMEDKKWKK